MPRKISSALAYAGALAAVLALAAPANARDLFAVSATDGVLTSTASGNSIIDLFSDLLDQEGAFAGFGASPLYTADINYLGIEDAIRFTVDPVAESATIFFALTGDTIMLSASGGNELGDAFEDCIKEQDCVSAWAKLLEGSNGKSKVAVLDGNPRSTTAFLANSAFDRFGLHGNRNRLGYEQRETDYGGFILGMQLSGGSSSAGGFDGKHLNTTVTLGGEFSDRVSFDFSILAQLRSWEGAENYDVGFEVGLPIRILRPSESNRFFAQVTPVIQVGAGASIDAAAGGLMVGGGAVGSFGTNLPTPIGTVELTAAGELIYYGGAPLNNIGGYDFETELDRLMMKYGGKAAYHVLSYLYVDAGISLTHFLVSDAAVPTYTTPFLGAGVHLGDWLNLRASYEADAGSDFSSHTGRAQIDFLF